MNKVKLKDVCEAMASNIAQKDISVGNGDYPIYGASGFIGNVDFYKQEKPYIGIVKDGAGVGRAYLLPEKSSVIGTMQYILPKDNIDIKYLYYAIQYMHLEKYYSGATIPHIYFRDYQYEPILLPGKKEQEQKTNVLEKIDKLVFKHKKTLRIIDTLVKSRFIEMFEHVDIPIVKAESIINEMRNGLSPSSKGTFSEKVLTLSAITQGSFDITAYKDGVFDVCPPDDKRVNAQDFYICRGNGNISLVGIGAYADRDYYDFIFPDTVIAAQVDLSRVTLPYLSVAWQQPSVRRQIEKGARTTNGTYKINQQIISNIELRLPSIEKQEKFADFVALTDKSKLSIQQSIETLQTLKAKLMQDYFG